MSRGGSSVARVEGASFSSPPPPPPVGGEREGSEEEVKDKKKENETKKRKVFDWGNSESFSSEANSDGPENET